ncbi:MAG: extracellular solute-binding protein, partial [Firmicutes bacterium]|nr:extracellular solute-binding protein [Bacillota bacterium]
MSGGTADWIDRTYVQLAAGTAPDIMRTWGPFHVAWAEAGLLLDLSPFVERDLTPDDIADFFPTTWEGGQLQFGPKAGLRFGMPRHVN